MLNKPEETAAETANETLENNSNVSKSVVAQYRELERDLKRLGVDTRPRYTLSPPFGGIVSNLSQK